MILYKDLTPMGKKFVKGNNYEDGGYMAKGGVISSSMKKKIIDDLIIDRKNDLSLKTQQVNLVKNSLGNPKISVGVIPYYTFSKIKELTYVISYGRTLTLNMIAYESYKNDKSFIEVQGKDNAIKVLNQILDKIESDIKSKNRQ